MRRGIKLPEGGGREGGGQENGGSSFTKGVGEEKM